MPQKKILKQSKSSSDEKDELIKRLRQEIKALEKKSKESSDQLHLALEASQMGVWEVNLETGELNWPPQSLRLLGLKPTDRITFNRFMELVHPDDRQQLQQANEDALRDKPSATFEHRVIWPDGSIHWFLVKGKAMFKNNQPVKLVGAAINIDDLKKTQAALEASEKRYHAFVSNSNEGIWRVELDKPLSTELSIPDQIKHMYKHAYLAEANEAMAKMYGMRSSDSLKGLRLGDLLIESDPNNTAYLTAFIESEYSLSGAESHELDKNGKDKYFLNSLVGVMENGKLVRAWGTQKDVTDQHSAMEALKKSEERLALAMQVSRMGMWEWDVKTNDLHWTPELKELFGLKPNQKITYEKYISLLHPEDQKMLERTINKALKTGEMYQIDHRAVWPDGSTHWLQGQGQAFFEKGKPVRMLGTARDIDQRKTAEEALRESERLFKSMVDQQTTLVELNDAKDEFISLASHQLRTPATGVKQFIGMLLENYFGKLTEDQRTMLEYAYESNERQLEVINDLLKVAQVDAGKVILTKRKTDLTKLLENIMQGQRSQFTARKQRVVLDRPKEPITALVDESRIRMVVENLTDNASKYTPAGKSIIVSIDKTDDGKFIAIKVKDEGVGIAKDDIPRLFQKFLRLDNPLSIQVGGTGIGLYWAKKIVDLHGGTILLKSQLGKGTTFTVMIPA